MGMSFLQRSVTRLSIAVLAAAPFAASAAGGDPLTGAFQVNVYTSGDQQTPAVARSASGGFVVVWDSVGEDGSLDGVFARRLDASGNPQGGEFQVNQHAANAQFAPAVAINGNGDFVVAWQSNAQARSGVDVYARAFAADGTPRTGEIHVNDSGRDVYAQVGVGVDGAGNFVVVWLERDLYLDTQLLKLNAIMARRFAADGTALGKSFAVAASTADVYRAPALAMNDRGAYVVTWRSMPRGHLASGPGGLGAGVLARRFPVGTGANALTVPFTVNTYDSKTVLDLPRVAIDPDGNFVIAWEGLHLDQTPAGIFARRYDAAARAQGPPFRAGSAMQRRPAVALGSTGDFVIAGDGDGIYAQRYGADGSALGGEIRVDPFLTHNTEFDAGVGVDASGDFVVVWQDWLQDGDGRGVFARLYSGS
jgi:hypothetical protein